MTMMTTNPIFNMGLALIASAAVLTFVAGPAAARAVPVTVAKAELATPEGRAAVDARIESAARRACSGGVYGRDLTALRGVRACVQKAQAEARTQVATMITATRVASR